MPETAKIIKIETYQPLSSIWEGEDSELLNLMLEFYPRSKPKMILDATINIGRFWIGSGHSVIGLDVDRRYRPHVVGDNMEMPFKNDCFDVVVYDPPHIPNQGSDRQKDFNVRFGLVLKSSKENGYNFNHLFGPFTREAYRVLRPEGILLCKMTDYIHNHRYQWAHVEIMMAAVQAGFKACDLIVKIRKGPIKDPRWKTAHHTRRHHCYWIIFRKSKKCE